MQPHNFADMDENFAPGGGLDLNQPVTEDVIMVDAMQKEQISGNNKNTSSNELGSKHSDQSKAHVGKTITACCQNK